MIKRKISPVCESFLSLTESFAKKILLLHFSVVFWVWERFPPLPEILILCNTWAENTLSPLSTMSYGNKLYTQKHKQKIKARFPAPGYP